MTAPSRSGQSVTQIARILPRATCRLADKCPRRFSDCHQSREQPSSRAGHSQKWGCEAESFWISLQPHPSPAQLPAKTHSDEDYRCPVGPVRGAGESHLSAIRVVLPSLASILLSGQVYKCRGPAAFL